MIGFVCNAHEMYRTVQSPKHKKAYTTHNEMVPAFRKTMIVDVRNVKTSLFHLRATQTTIAHISVMMVVMVTAMAGDNDDDCYRRARFGILRDPAATPDE